MGLHQPVFGLLQAGNNVIDVLYVVVCPVTSTHKTRNSNPNLADMKRRLYCVDSELLEFDTKPGENPTYGPPVFSHSLGLRIGLHKQLGKR